MDAREYRTDDKTTWGPGPWQDEPDKAQWQDPTDGTPCRIMIAGDSIALGNTVNGVAVPTGGVRPLIDDLLR